MMQWRSLKSDNEAGGATDAARLMTEEPTQVCAFCRGKGEKPAGARCPVCRGKGTVEIRPPAVKCALCKGRGEERPRGNVTCNACRGTGYISVAPPIQKCASCRGTGRQRSSRLACTVCRGAGMVGAARHEMATAPLSTRGPSPRPAFTLRIGEPPPTGNAGPGLRNRAARSTPAGHSHVEHVPSVLASELEILRLYARASCTGERIILSDSARRTPAYVKVLQKGLIEKDLLRKAGPRKLEITHRGLQVAGKIDGDEAVKRSSGPGAPRSAEQGEGGPVGAGAAGHTAPAAAASGSPQNGVRWSPLGGT